MRRVQRNADDARAKNIEGVIGATPKAVRSPEARVVEKLLPLIEAKRIEGVTLIDIWKAARTGGMKMQLMTFRKWVRRFSSCVSDRAGRHGSRGD